MFRHDKEHNRKWSPPTIRTLPHHHPRSRALTVVVACPAHWNDLWAIYLQKRLIRWPQTCALPSPLATPASRADLWLRPPPPILRPYYPRRNQRLNWLGRPIAHGPSAHRRGTYQPAGRRRLGWRHRGRLGGGQERRTSGSGGAAHGLRLILQPHDLGRDCVMEGLAQSVQRGRAEGTVQPPLRLAALVEPGWRDAEASPRRQPGRSLRWWVTASASTWRTSSG